MPKRSSSNKAKKSSALQAKLANGDLVLREWPQGSSTTWTWRRRHGCRRSPGITDQTKMLHLVIHDDGTDIKAVIFIDPNTGLCRYGYVWNPQPRANIIVSHLSD